MSTRPVGSATSDAVTTPVAPDEARGADVVVSARGLRKSYGEGHQRIDVLRDVDLAVAKGEMVTIIGPSGSGKSSLLHVLSGLDGFEAGEVVINGRNLADAGERELADWRARHIGFVLQQNNFVPSLTIEENVAAPLILAGEKRKAAIERAREGLSTVGIAERAGVWPAEVSIGQLQRAALARAFVSEPILVFADEPTGALDSDNRDIVLGLFQEITKGVGAAAIVVTHDPVVAAAGDRSVRMQDGQLEEVGAA